MFGTSSSLIFCATALPKSAIFTPRLIRLTSIPASVFRVDATGNSGVIIDSGTSMARMDESSYTAVRDGFRAGTGNPKSIGGFSLFDTHYDLSGLKIVKVPTVVFHFQCQADASLLTVIQFKGTNIHVSCC